MDRHRRDENGRDDDAGVPRRRDEEGGLSDRRSGGRGALLPSYWSALSSTPSGNGDDSATLTSESTAYPKARLPSSSTVSEYDIRQSSLRRTAAMIAFPSLPSITSTNTPATNFRAIYNKGSQHGSSIAPHPASSVATIPSAIEAIQEDGGGVWVGGAAAAPLGSLSGVLQSIPPSDGDSNKTVAEYHDRDSSSWSLDNEIAMQRNRVRRGLCPGCGCAPLLNSGASGRKIVSLSVEDPCEVLCRVCRLYHRCSDGTHPLEASCVNDLSRGDQSLSKNHPMVANPGNGLGKGRACGWVDRNPRKIALISAVAVVALIAVSTALFLVAIEYQKDDHTVLEAIPLTNASDIYSMTFPTRSPSFGRHRHKIMNQPEYRDESNVAAGELDPTGGFTFENNIITVPISP